MSEELSIDLTDGPLTMTTIEIAELTKKEHKNILRDCRNMFDECELQSAQFRADYKDERNRLQEMFVLDKEMTLTLISGYNVKLRRAIIKRWAVLEKFIPELLTALQNADPVVLQHMTNIAKKAQGFKEERDIAVKTKSQIGSRQLATTMAKLSHLSPIEKANNWRVKLWEEVEALGYIHTDDIGDRVRDMLGSRRLVKHPDTVRPEKGTGPNAVNQALIDLGYQESVPYRERTVSKKFHGKTIKVTRPFIVPYAQETTHEGSKYARTVIMVHSYAESKYSFSVSKTLRWDPAVVKPIYEYMLSLKRERESKAKAKKAETTK